MYSKCFLCVPFAYCFFALKVWNAQKAGASAVLLSKGKYSFLYLSDGSYIFYCWEKPSPTSAKNKVKLEYISEGQLSPLELAFGAELGINSHYDNFFIALQRKIIASIRFSMLGHTNVACYQVVSPYFLLAS